MKKTEKEKQYSGEIYDPGVSEIMEGQLALLDTLREYNEIPHVQLQRREEKLRSMFAELGENCYVESPFHANFAGKHVHFGKNIYANFNLTLVDDSHIYVGDYTMIGPNVTIATAGHPINPELRKRGLQYAIPVHIGKNCWLGAGVVVLPGVTIGDNVVIGAGSIVTRDIPSNVVAAGNPCRILREVGEKDRMYYFKDRPMDPTIWQEYAK